MKRLFEDREHAAETLFVQAEEAYFLRRRRGVRSLAAWASKMLGHDADAAEFYEQDLIVWMVKGTSDDILMARVGADLKAKGHATNDAAVRDVFARAAAVQPSPFVPL